MPQTIEVKAYYLAGAGNVPYEDCRHFELSALPGEDRSGAEARAREHARELIAEEIGCALGAVEVTAVKLSAVLGA